MDTIDKLFRAAGLASIPEGVVAPALVPLCYSIQNIIKSYGYPVTENTSLPMSSRFWHNLQLQIQLEHVSTDFLRKWPLVLNLTGTIFFWRSIKWDMSLTISNVRQTIKLITNLNQTAGVWVERYFVNKQFPFSTKIRGAHQETSFNCCRASKADCSKTEFEWPKYKACESEAVTLS